MSTTLPDPKLRPVSDETPATGAKRSPHSNRQAGGGRGPSFGTDRRRFPRPLVWGASALVAVTVVAWIAWWTFGNLGDGQDVMVLHTVSRGVLPIVVTARGNLESQTQTDIRCEVESVAFDRSSGQNGTQIIFIVPNGSSVAKGDLLVEFDTAPLKEMIDNQILAYEKAHADTIQAVAKFKNQITQNQTLLAEAGLAVELANLQLEMYDDEGDGTYQIALGELDLSIQESMNKIVEAQASLLLKETERDGIETLYKLGYRGRGDYDQSVFAHIRAEDELVRATNALANLQSSRKKLEHYEYPMRMLELDGAVKTAGRNLTQTGRDNTSLLAQAEAAKIGAERTEKKETEKLDRYQAQLERSKIYAPHDGMVVYANERRRGSVSSVIAEGAFIRERQNLLKLPDLSSMQVKTGVHESVLDQVRPGLKATIRVDASPDRVYRGTVRSVAVLPDQGNWLASDTKYYQTVITIDESVEKLKPGMTAVVEIHVDRLEDVMSVPVQSIVQRGRNTWCYTLAAGEVERRSIQLGRTNDRFVQIRDGLNEGDRVVLNPMSIVDEASEPAWQSEQSDIEGEGPTAEEIAAEAEDAGTQLDAARVADPLVQVGDAGKTRPGRGERNGERGGDGRGGERNFRNRELTPEMRARMEAFRKQRRSGSADTAGENTGGGNSSEQRRSRRARRDGEANGARPRRDSKDPPAADPAAKATDGDSTSDG